MIKDVVVGVVDLSQLSEPFQRLKGDLQAFIAQLALVHVESSEHRSVRQKSCKLVEVARSDDVSLEVQIGHVEDQVSIRVESDKKVNLFNVIVSDVERQIIIVVHDKLLRKCCEATTAQLVICQVQINIFILYFL